MNVKFLRTEIFSRDKVVKGFRLLEKGKGRRVFSTRKFDSDYSYKKGKIMSELKYIKKENMFQAFADNSKENMFIKF